MRVQHNISSMNAYRNFSTNNSKLTKNLEKLSTGYKINRAGDDAAGLAISEKMRAQITGLEGATKNAKDGISLIQTAEGALTEVHDMLNRMVTLSEQSANGTYDDSVDRNQLQKEVVALKSEINRVAESTNYNGIKLLDGSLSGAGNLKGGITASDINATVAKAQSTQFGDAAVSLGDKLTYTVSWKDGDGNEKSASVSFTVGVCNGITTDVAAETQGSALVASDGTKYAFATKNTASSSELRDAIVTELGKNSDIRAAFTVSAGTGDTIATTNGSMTNNGTGQAFTVQLDSKVAGSKGATVTGLELTHYQSKATNTPTVKVAAGSDVGGRQYSTDNTQKLNLNNIRVLVTTDTKKTDTTIPDSIFEVNGKKFALFSGTDSEQADIDKLKEKIGSDVTIIQLQGTSNATTTGVNYTANTTDAQIIAGELSRVTGMKFEARSETVEGTTKDQIIYTGTDTERLARAGEGKALMLQVGDTSDSFNRVGVSIGDMHTASLGLEDLDISTQDGAAAAISTIKAAVNQVSDTRGGLGALQNRLDHTINNLGVMRENIQNAESLIRDTDMAEEMTTYTKNNILNQAAQAMLAQANQLPQGVLQLLG